MRPSLAWALVPVLLVSTRVAADDPQKPDADAVRPPADRPPSTSPARTPDQTIQHATAMATAAARNGRLNLGPFGRPYTSPLDPSTADLPRFHSSVEVQDKAPPAPKQPMD